MNRLHFTLSFLLIKTIVFKIWFKQQNLENIRLSQTKLLSTFNGFNNEALNAFGKWE